VIDELPKVIQVQSDVIICDFPLLFSSNYDPVLYYF